MFAQNYQGQASQKHPNMTNTSLKSVHKTDSLLIFNHYKTKDCQWHPSCPLRILTLRINKAKQKISKVQVKLGVQ